MHLSRTASRLLLMLCLCPLLLQAQSGRLTRYGIDSSKLVLKKALRDAVKPELGKPMPDYTLNNVTHYPASSVPLSAFKGKWLMLYMYTSTCHSALMTLRKADEWHKRFAGSIQVIAVDIVDDAIKPGNWCNIDQEIIISERLREKWNLSMPMAYVSDISGYHPENGWGSFPLGSVFVIGPDGVYRYLASSADITHEQLQRLIDGQEPGFAKSDPLRVDFDPPGYKDDRISSLSILQPFNHELYRLPPIDAEILQAKSINGSVARGFFTSGLPLPQLYNEAYFGTANITSNNIYPMPVLEVKDPTPFRITEDRLRNAYNYALKVPAAQLSRDGLMRAMQMDLKRYFGYQGTIERRSLPVWKLVAKPGAVELLRTKGGEPFWSSERRASGLLCRNQSVINFVDALTSYVERQNDHRPFVDETGIFNSKDAPEMDIDLDCDMTDLESIRKAIAKYNLDIVPGERVYTALIIRDATPVAAPFSLDAADSAAINKHITKFIPANGTADWKGLEAALEKTVKDGSTAKEIILQTKIEYAIANGHWKDFEAALWQYLIAGFYHAETDQGRYLNLAVKYSPNKRLLNVVMDHAMMSSNMAGPLFALVNVRYKLGAVQHTDKWVHIMMEQLIASDTTNQAYKEAYELIKKGKKTWVE